MWWSNSALPPADRLASALWRRVQNGVTLAIEDANAEKPTIDGKPVKFELLAEDDPADRKPPPKWRKVC